MKITICTFGSRGDIQPYLALAVGLQQAGHKVTLAAAQNFAEWIRSYGVNAYPVRIDAQAGMQEPKFKAAMESHNLLRQLQGFRHGMDMLMTDALDDCWQAAHEAEFLILGTTAQGGVDIANQRKIPMAFAALQQSLPTRAYPSFIVPFSLGGSFNKLSHSLFLGGVWLVMGKAFSQWRTKRFGLPPWRSMQDMFNTCPSDSPWLMGYSPLMLPKPPDWEMYHHVTGYWFLDAPANWQPAPELAHFLESGPPPVYVGFGSMSDKDPERRTRMALRALELTGQRGVLSTGWGGVARLKTSANVIFVDDVPHSCLFPRMAAVVHHGGAGTTAAGLRAGVPSLIAPFMLDQFFWANKIVKLGVGPRLPDAKNLTAEKLAQAIDIAVTGTNLRARAAAFGEKIRAENGVSRAVEIIDRYASDFTSGSA